MPCADQFDMIVTPVYCMLSLYFAKMFKWLRFIFKLTYWRGGKMTAVLKITFWNSFSCMKFAVFQYKCHWHLFSVVKWHQADDTPLSETRMVHFTDAHMRHLASMIWRRHIHVSNDSLSCEKLWLTNFKCLYDSIKPLSFVCLIHWFYVILFVIFN